jgi:hypothetical protein
VRLGHHELARSRVASTVFSSLPSPRGHSSTPLAGHATHGFGSLRAAKRRALYQMRLRTCLLR